MSATLDHHVADRQRANTELQHRLDEMIAERDEVTAERDRALAERDEALARETAIAEILQSINSSPGDLAPVFDAMLEKAMALCGAAFGHLDTYDGRAFHTAAVRGVPAKF